MAFKCWKQKGRDEWHPINPNDWRISVAVRKNYLSNTWQGTIVKKGEVFNGVDVDTRTFKTRNAALKFVKAYMKKHDKC